MRLPLLALLLLAGSTPARAQSATDPAETVRAFYRADSINAVRFYAKRLRALYARDRREAGGEVGRLGFDFRVNGQDTEDGWEKTLRLTVVSFAEDRAEIGAAFRNFTAQDIRYSLVREDGRWLIADARSLNPERWRLTEILSRPLP